MPSTIKLTSSDGKEFSVDVEVAKSSVTIQTMLEHLGMEEGDKEEVIPLPNVDGEILELVIKWAKHHKDDPPEESSNKDEISEWDENFLKIDNEVLFALTRAANYLDVKRLLDVTCKTVANLMKGKEPHEIRKLFGLPVITKSAP